MPSSATDAKGLLKTAIRSEDPIIFLEHKALYRAASARSPEPDKDYLIPLGKARTVREGTDLTIVTYGLMVYKSLMVARQLSRENQVSVEVVDLRTLVPLDIEAVLDSVRKTHRLLVVHEDHEFLGYGAEICAQLGDMAFNDLDAPIRRVAGKFSFVPSQARLSRKSSRKDEDILTAARSLATW